MIKIDDETRQAIAKYVGPDGRLIIDESLPEDIKEAFQFFNDEGVNILDFGTDNELHLHVEDEEDDEIDDEEIDVEASEKLSTEPVAASPVSSTETLSAEKIAEVNQDLNDLNNMF